MKWALTLTIMSLILTMISLQEVNSQGNIQIFQTAKDTDKRLSAVKPGIWSDAYQPTEGEPSVFIDPAVTFEKFLGIGGAFTDAAAETFYQLSPDKQQKLLKLYFDPAEGIGYTLGRTNINSCDFSSDMYTYVKEGDKELKTFDVSHDKKYKIPFIKEALKITGGKLKLFASPWSPPAYMKDNNNMLQGGKLLPEYYDTWARYYVRFINEYAKNGINLWGISVQNEPMAKQTWESCIFTADEETDFIAKHLGPVLHKNKMKNIRLIAWDHNRDLLYQRASALLKNPAAAKYIWGIGFHWYEIWNGGRQYDNVQLVKNSFPKTNLLLTEACNYPFSWSTFDQWHWGENYGENMIEDFNNGAIGWTDWNLVLDEKGGPNHVNNFCFAPIHVKTGENSIHLMNSYYYIGHFSKFIRPEATRIAASSNRAQLLTTAFRNADGSRVVVIMNKSDEKFETNLFIEGKRTMVSMMPHSIVTCVVR